MLEVRNLTKTFGDYYAVDHLSFKIEPGSIMGLIGQNGAGKTTTFRLILDFLTANQGEILWNGKKSEKMIMILSVICQKNVGSIRKFQFRIN